MKEYFSHDYNARNDSEMVKLQKDFGLEGIGIYWCIVEMLYENNGKILLDEVDTIAYDLRTQSERITNVLKSGLFKFKNDYFYSESVNKRLKLRKEKSESARQSALSRWNKDTKVDANAIRTQSERNAIKVKESKVKESKVKYAENVLMTEIEYKKLVDTFCDKQVNWMINKLDNYKGAKGKKYKSDYRAILSWVVAEYEKQHPKTGDEDIKFYKG